MDRIVCRPLGIPSASLIVLTGILHGEASQELSQIVRHLAHTGVRWIVFDLAEGGVLDSRTLGSLLLASRVCERRHGRAALLSPPPSVRSLLAALGMADRFLVSDDIDVVMAHVRRCSAAGNREA